MVGALLEGRGVGPFAVGTSREELTRGIVDAEHPHGGSNISTAGVKQVFGLSFHLPGFHFGPPFLSHTHMDGLWYRFPLSVSCECASPEGKHTTEHAPACAKGDMQELATDLNGLTWVGGPKASDSATLPPKN